MARPLRLCVPGGFYHVIARGNARGRIYRDDLDRMLFLERLEHPVDRYGWLCHSYCLMDNHYHLVVETPQPNLPFGMRQLNGLYASRFNRRYKRSGHVFEARYRSVLVEGGEHLLSVCRYVVLNPVRAGLCERAEDWRWSSYRATAGLEPAPRFLTTEVILSELAPTRAAAQSAYREFVAEGLGEALEERVRGERLGGFEFLRKRFGVDPPLPEVPRAQIEPERRPLAEIFAHEARAPVAAAYRRHGYTLREIAEHLGCHYSTVSRRLAREEAAA
ncbi:MAG: transposase [Actinomycetota bacterium]|nr:transposase [Actinomycetota bacterium]